MAKKLRKHEVDESMFDIDCETLADLEEQWVQQPRLFFKASVALAEAKLDSDAAKAKLDVTYAEVDSAIRADPESYGLEKATEPGIKAAIPLQDDYIEAQQAVHDAKHLVGILQAQVDALDQRKRTLENLVHLKRMTWDSEPRIVGGTQAETREMKANAVLGRRRRRKQSAK